MKHRTIWLMLTAFLLSTFLAACGGSSGGGGKAGDGSLDRVKKAGVLVVAVDATYPPMEFIDKDGKTVIGFDVDLATEVAKKLGVQVKFEVVDWDGIITGLTGKRYDMIMSSMNITEERQKQVNFVEYAKMSQVFVSKKGIVPVRLESDLSGKVVAVQAETTSHEWIDQIKKTRVPDIKEIRSLKGATDAFAEVKNGRADVIVIDEPVGLYYAKLESDIFAVTGQAMKPEPIGAAIRKEDVDLRNAVSKAISEMKNDGSMKTLMIKWFGRELGI